MKKNVEKDERIEIAEAANRATQLISDAAERATTTIANAVLEATKLLALNAAEATKLLHEKNASDHDLLIELRTRMEGLKNDIKEMRDGHAIRIDNHESRLKTLCEWRATLDGENGLLVNVPKNCVRIGVLENSALELKTRVKTWLIIGGVLIWILTYLLDKILLPLLK